MVPQEKFQSQCNINTALHHCSSDLKHLDLELGDFIFIRLTQQRGLVEGEAAVRPLDSALIFHVVKLEHRMEG